MQVILLLVGLLLLFVVNATWAPAAGVICLVVFGVITAVQLVAVFAVKKVANKQFREFDSRFGR